MKARVIAILTVLVMMFTLIPMAAASNSAPPDAPEPVVNCTSLRVGLDRVEIKCTAAGIVVLDTTVALPPGPTITLPPILGPTKTVTVEVPGPRETRTIEVEVPGPTQTVTAPAATETVVQSGPTSQATVTASGPTSQTTATTTVTTDPGQEPSEAGTMDPEPSDPVISIPLPDDPLEAAALGTGALLILAALILLGLYLGYYLGYRDSNSKNANFMRALLNRK